MDSDRAGWNPGDLRQVSSLLGTPEVPGALRILGVPELNQHKFKRLPAWKKKKERMSRSYLYCHFNIFSVLGDKGKFHKHRNYSYQSPKMRVQLFAPPPEQEGIQGEVSSTLARSVDVAVQVDTRCGQTASSVSRRQVGDGPCSFCKLCPARNCVHTHTHTHTHTVSDRPSLPH